VQETAAIRARLGSYLPMVESLIYTEQEEANTAAFSTSQYKARVSFKVDLLQLDYGSTTSALYYKILKFSLRTET
jgi:hypothetical protein